MVTRVGAHCFSATRVRGHCLSATRVSRVACSSDARGGVDTAVEAQYIGGARACGVLCGMGTVRLSVACHGCDAKVVDAASHAHWVGGNCLAATRMSGVAASFAAGRCVETAIEAHRTLVAQGLSASCVACGQCVSALHAMAATPRW
ncbi:unnamed protein product [Polarella glacialis]|uniref:Uncharacterized protein n=1 Tax=Polarella glacialis TaxID=89957 RepID=A0A813GDN9_POLGL|nr:unnamed protein product [Polarella glacialis]